jgi:hypothetical protein
MRQFFAEGQNQQAARPRGRAARPGLSLRAGSSGSRIMRIYLRPRAALFERPFDGDRDVRFVREAVRPRCAVERAVLLRRVEREVLRDALRRFVPLLRRAVDFRAVDFRAVDLRAVDLRPGDLRAVDLRPGDRRVVLREVLRLVAVVLRAVVLRAAVLRPVVLRPVALRPVALRPDVFRPDVLRPEDAPVLPVRSRRFVRARLRLFSDGLS